MSSSLSILALEPFYGGSHRAFLDGWIQHSQHQWHVLGLPDYKWKWRMRHAGITFAQQVHQLMESGNDWDVVWCSDMLHLPDFLALTDRTVTKLPRIIYFHENQFTYPNQRNSERDFHFAFSNFVSAISADAVWFNSQFHQSEFLNACESFLRRMPDFSGLENIDLIREKSSVHYPGVETESASADREANTGAIRFLWNARWEHDKNPTDFFQTIRRLKSAGVDFKLNVVGQSFGTVPEVFESARTEFANEIEQWGFAKSRHEYLSTLEKSDVVVSTANHEFFGIGVVEAMNAGVVPLLPNRLSYPELLRPLQELSNRLTIYNGTIENLIDGIKQLEQMRRSDAWQTLVEEVKHCGRRFEWKVRASQMDAAVSVIHQKHHE